MIHLRKLLLGLMIKWPLKLVLQTLSQVVPKMQEDTVFSATLIFLQCHGPINALPLVWLKRLCQASLIHHANSCSSVQDSNSDTLYFGGTFSLHAPGVPPRVLPKSNSSPDFKQLEIRLKDCNIAIPLLPTVIRSICSHKYLLDMNLFIVLIHI